MSPLYPCLWFAGEAEAAAEHYLAVFPGARHLATTRYPAGTPGVEGSVLTVNLQIGGGRVLLLDGARDVPFTEAVSLVFACPDQATIDRVWDGLLAGGGREIGCGWIADRFGVTWQITPTLLDDLTERTPEAFARVMQALVPMVRIDVATLEAAARG